MRTGMNINKIMWGLSCSMMAVDCPNAPKLYLKYPKSIPSIRSIGVYGIFVFLFTYLSRPPRSNPTKMNKTTNGPL
jgi:hypothetical protein